MEDLNNELEAIVISKENKLNADKEMEFCKEMLSIKSAETKKGLNH